MDIKIIISLFCVCLISISVGVGVFFMMRTGNSTTQTSEVTPEPTPELTFKPTPVPANTISGCEGENKPLVCPSGKVVTSGEIKYGRWDNSICPHPTVNSSTPSVFKTYPVTPGMDSISGIDTVKDDPYPDVFKHYTVNYTCT